MTVRGISLRLVAARRRLSQTTTSRRTSAKSASAVGTALWVGVSSVLESRASERRLPERVVLHSVCPRASVKQTSPALFLPPSLPTLPHRRVSRGPRGRHMSSVGGAAATAG